VEKVNSFYDAKVEELEKHLALLTESVVTSLRERQEGERLESTRQDRASDDGGSETISPFPPASRKKQQKSIHKKIPSVDWRDLVARITGKTSTSIPAEEVPQAVLDVDELYADDLDSVLRKSQVKMIAEADSIQRALVDQYRTAKLLHNFALMNYTGFVKIVKKHDKSLPHRKGRFKALTQAANICGEGLVVEQLSQRIELRYAHWFCDGNSREANAQLLPKKGDGLDQDWSQLR
jgi:SPX domain